MTPVAPRFQFPVDLDSNGSGAQKYCPINAIPPSDCPVCGADVPPNARACPECGADERSGWNEDATRYDGLNLPDDPGEDEPSRKSETQKGRIVKNGIPVFWWAVAVVVIVLFACLLLKFSLPIP